MIKIKSEPRLLKIVRAVIVVGGLLTVFIMGGGTFPY